LVNPTSSRGYQNGKIHQEKWEIAGEGLFVELQAGQYESYPEEITVLAQRDRSVIYHHFSRNLTISVFCGIEFGVFFFVRSASKA
jgi:hypothetical protein